MREKSRKEKKGPKGICEGQKLGRQERKEKNKAGNKKDIQQWDAGRGSTTS